MAVPSVPFFPNPSYYGPTAGNAKPHNIVPAAGQEIRTAIGASQAWVETPVGSEHYEQAAYGYNAAVYVSGVDRFVNWWAGNYGNANQSPDPKPVFYGEAQTAGARGMLPLSQFIGNQSGTDQLMCTTCHNPHGTDLYTYDSLGGNQSITDNNMLRLRDSDSTLCNACH